MVPVVGSKSAGNGTIRNCQGILIVGCVGEEDQEGQSDEGAVLTELSCRISVEYRKSTDRERNASLLKYFGYDGLYKSRRAAEVLFKILSPIAVVVRAQNVHEECLVESSQTMKKQIVRFMFVQHFDVARFGYEEGVGGTDLRAPAVTFSESRFLERCLGGWCVAGSSLPSVADKARLRPIGDRTIFTVPLRHTHPAAGSDISAGERRRRPVFREDVGAAVIVGEVSRKFLGFIPGAVPHGNGPQHDVVRHAGAAKRLSAGIYEKNGVPVRDAALAGVFGV